MTIELIHVVIAVVFLAVWAFVARIVLHEGYRDTRTRQEASSLHSSTRVDERHMEGTSRTSKVQKHARSVEVETGRQIIRPKQHVR